MNITFSPEPKPQPSKLQTELCLCGNPLDTCEEAYSHMTQGV